MNTMQYFELSIDLQDHDAWYLGAISEVDNWRLVRPPMIPVDSPLRDTAGQPYKTILKHDGKPMDYTVAGYASVPVASFKVIRALSGLGGFTGFPVDIEGFAQKDLYNILHFWDVADCFDEARSSFEIIPENDPIRPDLAGNYRSVTKLVIDPDRAEGKHIFRIARLEGRVIVSEEVKRRFEAAAVTGAVFLDVTRVEEPLA